MPLESVQVTDAILDELRTDQLTRRVPRISIGGEDRVTEERLPVIVEWLALAEVAELRGQDGLDVLGVGGEDDALAGGAGLDGVVAVGVLLEDVAPALEVVVVGAVVDGFCDEIEA